MAYDGLPTIRSGNCRSVTFPLIQTGARGTPMLYPFSGSRLNVHRIAERKGGGGELSHCQNQFTQNRESKVNWICRLLAMSNMAVYYQMDVEDENMYLSNARFRLLEQTSQDAKQTSPPIKKYWYKDIRHSWERVKTNKAKPLDEINKTLVFALKHRVCGTESLVRGYIQGSLYQEEHLLTYENYVTGTHPDLTNEKEMVDKMITRQKPFYSLEELCYIAKKFKLMKIKTGRRLQSGSKNSSTAKSKSDSRSVESSSATAKNLSQKRLLKKLSELDTSTSAINVVHYNLTKGIGLKTFDIPQLHGAMLRYLIKPIPIVANNYTVYCHIVDIIYPDESSTMETVEMKEAAKMGMAYLIKLQDKNIGPTVDLSSIRKSVQSLQSPNCNVAAQLLGDSEGEGEGSVDAPESVSCDGARRKSIGTKRKNSVNSTPQAKKKLKGDDAGEGDRDRDRDRDIHDAGHRDIHDAVSANVKPKPKPKPKPKQTASSRKIQLKNVQFSPDASRVLQSDVAVQPNSKNKDDKERLCYRVKNEHSFEECS